ncbi:alpha/beta hydrolase [Pseudovibrio sp. SPO723]|uniref:alpha/beta hydrolase n=1 Tax=Nesiotobacter zosterae TaxID=392721 RepID=UPI0029C507E0|nr:alpha/beta fold hydrolase [Pseudovibrio sp. SPO723]MDX5595134.1 alpha/beta fold hydrolase [Pseudovibrio sp. SPO723]
MRNLFVFIAIVAIALVALFFFGPRASDDTQITFDPGSIGEDIDAYLAEEESKFNDMREGLEKQVIWANPETKEKTEYAVVYIHGFSASKEEIRPVPDRVADTLRANLYYTRLTGHGRSSAAMAESSLPAWLNDLAEALEIASRIGNKTIVIATSTGGSLAAWGALSQSPIMERTEAVVLFSPNFGPNAFGAFLLAAPYAEYYVPMLLGQTYGSSAGATPEEDYAWTLSYPSVALIPMAASVDAVKRLDPSTNTIPTLFIYSEKDKTVDPLKTNEAYDLWGGTKERILVETSGDPEFHVNAGDIVSPQNNDSVTKDILDWLKSLGVS